LALPTVKYEFLEVGEELAKKGNGLDRNSLSSLWEKVA
jgi:hypothetical protein